MVKELRLGLYVITGAYAELGRGHLDIARAALEGGADALQLRDKEAGGRGLLRLAVELRDLVDRHGGGCLLMVNDRVDVALASGADGVHLGQEDLPAPVARGLAGGKMIVGISVSTVEEAMLARAEGADYVGAGPVFTTPTKTDTAAPIGLGGLRAIVEAVDLPVVAIGGINEDNVAQVLQAGVDGVAVISAVATATHMLEATRRLRWLVDSGKQGR